MFSSWDLDYVLISNPEHTTETFYNPQQGNRKITNQKHTSTKLVPGQPGKYTELDPEQAIRDTEFSVAPQWMKFDGQTKLTKDRKEITLYGYGWTPAPPSPYHQKVLLLLN